MIFPQSEGLASLNHVQFKRLSLKKTKPILENIKRSQQNHFSTVLKAQDSAPFKWPNHLQKEYTMVKNVGSLSSIPPNQFDLCYVI